MEKARILIVEDEELVALGIRTYLDGIGHLESFITTSGEAAISAIPQCAPDLVLMDISLAGEMSGIEAAKIITDSFHLPIVYLTAYSDEKTLESAKIAQPYGYITKPFDERNLQATIEMALYKASLQEKMRQTEEKLENILSSVGDGIVVTGPTGMVDFMNANAVALLGLDAPPPQRVSILTILRILDDATGKQLPLNLGDILVEGRSLALKNCRIVGAEAKEFLAEVDLVPLHGETGPATGLVLTFRDVGKRAIP
jgi:CheY-like chemotaxis protein